jgi:hypothetical protein
MGPKRRKTGSAAPTAVKQSDQEESITAALFERLVRCQDVNGPASDSDDFKVDIDSNLPDRVRLGAHQAASILQVCDRSRTFSQNYRYARHFRSYSPPRKIR